MAAPERVLIKEFRLDHPAEKTDRMFIFAHGAGVGMSAPFMETVAEGLADNGIRVLRFHFPYMEEMVRSGTRRPPDGGAVLRQAFAEVISHCIEKEGCIRKHLYIGGKSMGGRIASMVADDHQVAGVVCFGYPFHPPRKPEKLRIEHLQTLTTPMLICQGERDSFGHRIEVNQYNLSDSITIKWITDGDHSFKPRKASGVSLDENITEAVSEAAAFMH